MEKEARINKDEKEIAIPHGVEVEIRDRKISVKGPKGTVEKDFDDPRFNEFVSLEKQGEKIVVKAKSDKRKIKSMFGTIGAIVTNMIKGATHGYKYTMKIVYTHFPITVTVDKNRVHVKNFLGEKGSRTSKIVGDTEVHVEKEFINITGADVESVSQTAANIEQACKLRGRDRRIFQDGIYLTGRHLQTGEKT